MLYLNIEHNWRLSLINEDNSEEKIRIEKLDDIYLYKDKLIERAKMFS